MTKRVDAIVVGGGIHGCSTALHLCLAGMKPVLVTSLTRRQFRDDGKIHSTLVPYVDVVKQIAGEQKVPLIDLHARSIELCESLGKEGCYAISPKKDNGDWDNTHLNAKGAEMIGALVTDELKKAVPELATHIRSSPTTREAK